MLRSTYSFNQAYNLKEYLSSEWGIVKNLRKTDFLKINNLQ